MGIVFQLAAVEIEVKGDVEAVQQRLIHIAAGTAHLGSGDYRRERIEVTAFGPLAFGSVERVAVIEGLLAVKESEAQRGLRIVGLNGFGYFAVQLQPAVGRGFARAVAVLPVEAEKRLVTMVRIVVEVAVGGTQRRQREPLALYDLLEFGCERTEQRTVVGPAEGVLHHERLVLPGISLHMRIDLVPVCLQHNAHAEFPAGRNRLVQTGDLLDPAGIGAAVPAADLQHAYALPGGLTRITQQVVAAADTYFPPRKRLPQPCGRRRRIVGRAVLPVNIHTRRPRTGIGGQTHRIERRPLAGPVVDDLIGLELNADQFAVDLVLVGIDAANLETGNQLERGDDHVARRGIAGVEHESLIAVADLQVRAFGQFVGRSRIIHAPITVLVEVMRKQLALVAARTVMQRLALVGHRHFADAGPRDVLDRIRAVIDQLSAVFESRVGQPDLPAESDIDRLRQTGRFQVAPREDDTVARTLDDGRLLFDTLHDVEPIVLLGHFLAFERQQQLEGLPQHGPGHDFPARSLIDESDQRAALRIERRCDPVVLQRDCSRRREKRRARKNRPDIK